MKPLFIKKNGTVSKVSGIIMNLIPSYTLAEYNALTHKPLLWVRTDEDYAQIPSEDVSYGSGSVKDALDELNFSVYSENITSLTGVTCRMTVRGRVVTLDFYTSTTITTTNQWVTLGQVPERFRPAHDLHFVVYDNLANSASSSAMQARVVSNTGNVQAWVWDSQTARPFGSITYVF